MPRSTAAATNSRVPGSVVDGEEARDRPRTQPLDEGVELFADAGGCGIPSALRHELASFAQLGAQGALRVGDRVGHGSILSAAHSAPCRGGHSPVICA